MRRGFTILEVTLACVLGSILAVCAAGVLGMMARSDRALADRFEGSFGLERVSTVMRRAMMTLVMSDEPKPPPPPEEDEQPAEGEEEQTPEEPDESEEPAEDLPPPRFVLTTAPLLDLALMQWRRPWDHTVVSAEPQRLELVLDHSPVPDTWGMNSLALQERLDELRERYGSEEQRDRSAEDDQEPPDEAPVEELPAEDDEPTIVAGAIRGSFELWPTYPPDPSGAPSRKVGPDGQVLWSLWWRPLPPTIDPVSPGQELHPGLVPGALELCSDILLCRWTAFKGGERVQEHAGIWDTDLPAYVEMEIATASGLYSNWMFEIGYGKGPEQSISIPGEGDEESEIVGGQNTPDPAQGEGAGSGRTRRPGSGRDQQSPSSESPRRQRSPQDSLNPRQPARPTSPGEGGS